MMCPHHFIAAHASDAGPQIPWLCLLTKTGMKPTEYMGGFIAAIHNCLRVGAASGAGLPVSSGWDAPSEAPAAVMAKLLR